MELHLRLNLSVNDVPDNLPQDLDQANHPGDCISFLEKNQYSPDHICREGAVIPHVLNQNHQFLPLGQVGGGMFL